MDSTLIDMELIVALANRVLQKKSPIFTERAMNGELNFA